MATELLTGLVLRKSDYGATDEVVTLLTANELFTFIALGTRKTLSKNARALQLGNIIDVEIFRARLTNKLSRLKRAELRFQPPLNLFDTAEVLMQILRELQSLNQTSDTLFKAILAGYKYFGADYNHHVKTYIVFHSLKARGLEPELQQCRVCGRVDRINGFDFDKGGFTCALHTDLTRSLNFLTAVRSLASDINLYIQVEPGLNQQLFRELQAYLLNSGYF